jgi:hypothetical protein
MPSPPTIKTPLTTNDLESLTQRLEAAEQRFEEILDLVAELNPPPPRLALVQPCPDEPLGERTGQA